MLDQFRPMNLSGAARALGVDPLEVVRLMVACEADMTSLTLTSAEVADLRKRAGIESWWADGGLPEDADARRAAVRGALGQMLERGFTGDRSTRLDNLWRGLSVEQQVAIEQAVVALLEEGHLVTTASPRGVQVAVALGAEQVVRGVADGTPEDPAQGTGS